MDFINPPDNLPRNVTHRILYSQLYNHEYGCNIFLPPRYEDSGDKYPVVYHLHGWRGNESSEIWPLEQVYKNRRAITVFPNSSPVIGDNENLPVERMIVDELLPCIEGEYRTISAREGRSISGFSMGGGMAFCYAVKNPELFASVTAYAGTYHHYFHKDAGTVGAPPEKAAELYEGMIRDKRYLEEGNILSLVRRSAEKIRGKLEINIHIGADDVLFCDNEILRMHLDSLNIPHNYVKYYGAGHDLEKIL